ncbi:MFS transporter [Streptomyces sp. H10-C2]|uniref:MFS transporter n=1 Tax=unclassified Streptomyces TaxID=2593676 RepID=UPI0024B9E8B0|nr:MULTISPECIES: MFS transporter [unclassified Streptomyces]MDJ0343713.1 MFS transporter [Streptomyces sp. PH10-H1]MDJ0372360.1 MFS transporter [Streptomyces sp. H10-C2]
MDTKNALHRYRWLGYTAVIAASVMDLLDSTVANVAAPAIRAGLGGSYADLQWIAAGYTLAMAVALLTGGRLGDMYGRKRILLAGIAGFTLTSMVCATAQSPEMLILARIAQGVCGAVMLPQGFGLTRDLFPAAEMKKAWGIFGPLMGLSAVMGPIIAGVLIHADLFGTGWRMIFGINLPIGAFAFVMGWKYLPDVAPTARGARLDVPGVLLAGTGAFLLVFPLVQGRELGWPTWVRVMLVASLPVLAVFARYQVLRKRSGRTPLVEPSVFTKRAYVSGVAFAIAFTASMGGMILTLGIFLQLGLGYTALHSSLTTAPWALGALFGSAFGGIMMTRLGRRILHLGLILMGGGLLALYGVFQWAGADITDWEFAAPLLVGGAGMGMIFVPLFDIILNGVDGHEIGSASGTLQALQQLGMTLGFAVLGTVFFNILGGAKPGPAGHIDAALHAAGTTALCTVGLIALAFVLGFFLPKTVRSAEEEPVPVAEPAREPALV